MELRSSGGERRGAGPRAAGHGRAPSGSGSAGQAHDSVPSNALASCKSAVSKPSVNQL
jgi:hypothetical protein